MVGSWSQALVRGYVRAMLAVTARGLVAVSHTDEEARADIAPLPEGFTFEMKVLPAGPSFRVRKDAGVLRVDREASAKADVAIQMKHLRHALGILTFRESTARAVANNRMVVDGDVAKAMRLQRVLDRMQGILLPDLVAVRAIEELFPMTWREKLGAQARLVARMALGQRRVGGGIR